MRILPLAFDSMGVRSTATFVEADLKILVYPRVSAAPLRYGLLPTKLELKTVEEFSERVWECSKNTIIISRRQTSTQAKSL